MVDPFGFRPFGGGILSGGPAPFGFSPQAPQSPYASSGGSGRGDDDSARPTPAQFRCQNRDCGAPTGGVYYPLCPQCNNRLATGGGYITLENGDKIFKPIQPGDPYIPPFHRR